MSTFEDGWAAQGQGWPWARAGAWLVSLVALGCGVPDGDGIDDAEDRCPAPVVSADPHAPPGRVAGLSAGYAHSCALFESGTARCWGSDVHGQIGDGSLAGGRYPTPTSPLPAISALALGGGHTCASTVDECVWCWGDNAQGQLGTGNRVSSWVPVRVEGISDITQVSAFYETTIALTGAGNVLRWGAGENGIAAAPQQWTHTMGYSSVTLGHRFACGLRADKRMDCWGNNTFGQLGLGDTIDRAQPTVIPGLADVESFAIGEHSVCAVRSGGSVLCWGRNEEGAVGDGTTTDRHSPRPVELPEPIEAVSAYSHVCARAKSGSVFCWGDNLFDQVGSGAAGDIVSAPWKIEGLGEVRAIATGLWFTCALEGDHDVSCWGSNGDGQLGTGNYENSPTPVHVKWIAPP